MADENVPQETTELRLDEENELFFKISIVGAERRTPEQIRLVCETGDVACSFKGKETDQDGIVCFVVPALKERIKAGLYEARVEVIVDNRYFVPVKFRASFKQPMTVVAESLKFEDETQKEEPQINIKAQSLTKAAVASLREQYRRKQIKR
jgi:hypothetical protein